MLSKGIDFGVKPFKKGLAGFKRTESFACTYNRYLRCFTAEKRSNFSCLAQQDPKYSPKRKSFRIGSAFQRGRALSCRALCVKELRPLLMKAVFYESRFLRKPFSTKAVFYENRKTFLASRFGRSMDVSKKVYKKIPYFWRKNQKYRNFLFLDRN